MAENPRNDSPRRYDETLQPQNPPNSVVNEGARKAAVRSYFVPVVVLFVLIAVGLLYETARSRSARVMTPRSEVGTFGSTEGGHDPTPRPANTRAEIARRGSDLAPVTRLASLRSVDAQTMTGRRVSLTNVTVDSSDGNTFWLRDGDATFAVIAPATTNGAAKAGSRVSLSGRVELDEKGGTLIRADQVRLEER